MTPEKEVEGIEAYVCTVCPGYHLGHWRTHYDPHYFDTVEDECQS